jgi:glycosyltransferase involved in cell wall biosynthesis
MQTDSPPLISVVMPVYNTSAYVKEAIESILNQTYTHFEFLIFNDGSTDNSVDLIKTYNDPRIKLYDYPVNTGYVTHLNKGLEVAKGEFIARMDSDDIAYPERFMVQIQYLINNPEIGFCGTQVKYINTEYLEPCLPTNNDDIKISLITACALWHPTAMLRKQVLQAHNLNYDPDFLYTEDHDLWCKLINVTQAANLADTLLDYRRHDKQVSNTKAVLQKEARKEICKRYLCSLGFDVDASDIDILNHLGDFPISIKTYQQYISLVRTLNKIINQNRYLSAFNQERLTQYFYNYQTKLIVNLTSYNPTLLRVLIKYHSVFMNNSGSDNYFKIIIKSLLYWKTRV